MAYLRWSKRIIPLDWKGPAENWKWVTIIKDEYLARSDGNNSGTNSCFVQSMKKPNCKVTRLSVPINWGYITNIVATQLHGYAPTYGVFFHDYTDIIPISWWLKKRMAQFYHQLMRIISVYPVFSFFFPTDFHDFLMVMIPWFWIPQDEFVHLYATRWRRKHRPNGFWGEKIRGYPNSWMVDFMENPNRKWMI